TGFTHAPLQPDGNAQCVSEVRSIKEFKLLTLVNPVETVSKKSVSFDQRIGRPRLGASACLSSPLPMPAMPPTRRTWLLFCRSLSDMCAARFQQIQQWLH